MTQGFIKVGVPVNGRQTYFMNDETKRKRYFYSVPEQQVDKFEKYDKELTNRINALANIDAKQLTKNLESNHVYTKAQIVAAVAGLVGGGLPIALSMKFLKGTKRYIIGAVSGFILGGLSVAAGYIGTVSYMIQKEALKTKQGEDFKKFLKVDSNFDLRLERVDNLTR